MGFVGAVSRDAWVDLMSFKRPTLWRSFTNLPNGQVAMLQADLLDRDDGETWGVAACIESSRRACKLMRREGQTTGKAGLKGLRALLTMLRRAEHDLANTRKCANLRVQIEGKTQKMHDAYRYLARHGYAEYWDGLSGSEQWFEKYVREDGQPNLFGTVKLPRGKVGDTIIVDVGGADIVMTYTSDGRWEDIRDGVVFPALSGDRFLCIDTINQLPIVGWQATNEGA